MKRLVRTLGLVALMLSWPRVGSGLIIDIDYEGSVWTDSMKLVVQDAAKEWESIFCPDITVFIDFTWHEFQGEYDDAWGLSYDFEEDSALHLPLAADVELNTRLTDQYYWDPTPGDTTDDDKRLNDTGKSSIDAASVLKHEIAHAIGFASNYSKWDAMVAGGEDIDGDGDTNEFFLDFNGNGTYDPGETVLADGDDSHTADSFYTKGQSSLMGYPGFSRGEQARPSWVEIKALHEVYDYCIIPEPCTVIIWSLLAGLASTFVYWRRRAG